MADHPRHHDLGNAVNASDINADRLRLALDASGIALWDADFITGKVHLDARWAELIGDDPPLAVSIPFRRLLKLVDPEQSVGVPTAELLGRLGYRITYQADPRAALAAFEKDPAAYDLRPPSNPQICNDM